MGLFDFVKDAGEKIFGEDEDAIDLTAPSIVTEERKAELRAESIVRKVNEAGIAVDDFKVVVADEVATLQGSVATQEDSEKVTLCAGNQFGVSSVDCQLEVTNPEPEATFYTVVSGDSLSKIAKAQYGDAMKYTAIFEANRPMLEDPDKIYPGQVLRIPAL